MPSDAGGTRRPWPDDLQQPLPYPTLDAALGLVQRARAVDPDAVRAENSRYGINADDTELLYTALRTKDGILVKAAQMLVALTEPCPTCGGTDPPVWTKPRWGTGWWWDDPSAFLACPECAHYFADLWDLPGPDVRAEAIDPATETADSEETEE
jgi:hypothetical protein